MCLVQSTGKCYDTCNFYNTHYDRKPNLTRRKHSLAAAGDVINL